jgi:hypothetical protein
MVRLRCAIGVAHLLTVHFCGAAPDVVGSVGAQLRVRMQLLAALTDKVVSVRPSF